LSVELQAQDLMDNLAAKWPEHNLIRTFNYDTALAELHSPGVLLIALEVLHSIAMVLSSWKRDSVMLNTVITPRPHLVGRTVIGLPRSPLRPRAFRRPATFLSAVAVVAFWAITGPLFGFSDTWQLAINTGTTIVTFLMVFLIQATQNRDTLALHLKLDELIMATKNARNHIAGIEDSTEEEIGKAKTEMQQRAG
jgi:low affinity Fe/Cu permease